MKKIPSILILISPLIFSGLIYAFCIQKADVILINAEFVVTFIGIVLGLIITIVTFIFSSTDRIYQIIDKHCEDSIKNITVKDNYKTGFKDLIQNSTLIFVVFIILMIVIAMNYVDIPLLKWPFSFKKIDVINIVELGLLINVIIATIDSFLTLMNIMKIVLFIDSKKNSKVLPK